MVKFLKTLNLDLVDFKIEFGRLSDGTIVLADEISPDTCRLWDCDTKEKLDKGQASAGIWAAKRTPTKR